MKRWQHSDPRIKSSRRKGQALIYERPLPRIILYYAYRMTRDAHDGPDPRPTYLRAPSLPPQTNPRPPRTRTRRSFAAPFLLLPLTSRSRVSRLFSKRRIETVTTQMGIIASGRWLICPSCTSCAVREVRLHCRSVYCEALHDTRWSTLP